MKTTFPGYIRPTDEEFSELWKDAIIVVDANVLLNIYGYSSSTREHLFSLLEKLAARLWIPHQFALEYVRNRPGVIIKQAQNCRRVEKSLKALIEHDFRAKNTHPFASDEVLDKFEELCGQLDQARRDQEAMVSTDPYLDRILAMFDGKVGPEYATTQRDTLHEQARARYSEKIPPGYADQKEKPEPDRFGDFIAWRQVIDHAKSKTKPVILVTDDAKEDWWHIYGDRTLGPRPELVSEFTAECKTAFYMYSTATFTEHAPEHVDLKVEDAVLEELSRARDAQLSEKTPEKSLPKIPSDIKSEPLAKSKRADTGRASDESGDTSAKGGE